MLHIPAIVKHLPGKNTTVIQFAQEQKCVRIKYFYFCIRRMEKRNQKCKTAPYGVVMHSILLLSGQVEILL